MESYYDCDGGSEEQSMHVHQSVWMARWMQTSCNVSPRIRNHLPYPCESKGDDHHSEQNHLASDISKFTKGYRKSGAQNLEIMEEGLTTSSKHLTNEESELESRNGSTLGCKNGKEIYRLEALIPGIDNNVKAAASLYASKAYFYPVLSLVPPTSESSSGGPSFRCRKGEVNQLEHEGHKYCSHSALSILKENLAGHSNSGRSERPYLDQNNMPALLCKPSMANSLLPTFAREDHPRIQNRPGIRLAESEILHCRQYSVQKILRFLQDVDTMRLCTTMDSVKGISGGHARYSQAIHSLLITKKNDVKLGEENQNLKEPRVSAQFEGNTGGELHGLTPFPVYGQRLKLQLLSSYSDKEGSEKAQDVKALEVVVKNGSSAYTDAMDTDAFDQNNQISGKYCSSLKKDVVVENAEPSTSRTQSLDTERLVPHAEQPSNSISNSCPNCYLKPEQSIRWAKRLKLSPPAWSALASKSSKFCEADASCEETNKFANKITTSQLNSSDTILGCKDELRTPLPEDTQPLSRNSELPSADMAKNDQDISLTHFWIRRLCRNQVGTPQKKVSSTVYEPESSKCALNELSRKQLPSIAAMALVGKVGSSFRPCEYQKRGSFVVWNTKAFQES